MASSPVPQELTDNRKEVYYFTRRLGQEGVSPGHGDLTFMPHVGK